LPADRLRLQEILSQGNWELHEAADCREALALLRGRNIPVLLCERDHADGSWKDLLNATATLPAPPNLIVFSRLADDSLWAEVLNLGGFDVVLMPFEPEEVLRVIFAAWRKWSEVSRNSPQEKRRMEGPVSPPEEAIRRRGPMLASNGGSTPVFVQAAQIGG